MTEPRKSPADISLFAVATILIRNRIRILAWMIAGAILAGLSVLSKPPLYVASTSLVAQATEAGRSSLASLAGQFGVTISAGDQSQSPDFYSWLLRSRTVLLPIVRDTFAVAELGGAPATFASLFKLGPLSPATEAAGIKALRALVSPSVSKTTGAITVTVATKWPSVSLAILTELLRGVNEFNQSARRGQAAGEKAFVEGVLKAREADLHAAEERLQLFEKANLQYDRSPALRLEREHLDREVQSRQQVITVLSQAYEDARIREVRDTPIIAVVEAPWVNTEPEPRGRAMRVVLGLILGGIIGSLIAIISSLVRQGWTRGDADIIEFMNAVRPGRGE